MLTDPQYQFHGHPDRVLTAEQLLHQLDHRAAQHRKIIKQAKGTKK